MNTQISGALGCYDCGRPYAKGPDLVIPDKIWNQIAPKPGGGGVLCPNCINDRLEAKGFENVPAIFTSGPMALPPNTDAYLLLFRLQQVIDAWDLYPDAPARMVSAVERAKEVLANA